MIRRPWSMNIQKRKGTPITRFPRPENTDLYKKYQLLAEELENVYFTGQISYL